MTTRQKIIFGGMLGVLLAVVGSEAWLIAARRERHRALEAEIRQLESEVKQWTAQRERARLELETARAAVALATDLALEPANELLSGRERAAWLARTRQLKQFFASRPEQAIPELRLLSDRDWLRLAKTAQFDTEEQTRKVLAAARTQAKSHFVAQLNAALRAYTKQSNGQLPADIAQLIPYMKAPPDPAMLQRYHMTRTGSIAGRLTDWAIEERALIDPEHDSLFHIQATGGYGANSGPGVEFYSSMDRARRAYRAANGRPVENPHDLAMYFNPPLDAARQQRFREFVERMHTARKVDELDPKAK